MLLGPNGAGKSTLMNILTGDISITNGDAALSQGSVAVAGANLQEGAGIKTVFRNAQLGYCAQHDALFDELSVAEHLDLFGQIRGLVRFMHRSLFYRHSFLPVFVVSDSTLPFSCPLCVLLYLCKHSGRVLAAPPTTARLSSCALV